MKPMKIAFSVIALTAITAPVFAGDFSALDTNADGQVSFAEYKSIAISEGKTTTLAAQEFMRMAQGDAVLTEDEYFLAVALADQPYALQSFNVTAPLPSQPVETVTAIDTVEENLETVESIEPPVPFEEVPETMETKDMSAPVIMGKADEGETTSKDEGGADIENSEEMIDETPVEEGLSDLPDLESEPGTEIESETTETSSDTMEDVIEEPLDEDSDDEIY